MHGGIIYKERRYYIDESIKQINEGYFQCDAPFYSSNMKSGYVYQASVSVGTKYEIDVKLDMPSPPIVVATPMTTNPAGVSVSVSDITKTGFKICMSRSDGNYGLRVNWIAMC